MTGSIFSPLDDRDCSFLYTYIEIYYSLSQLEKQKNDLLRELEDLKLQLEEQGGATAAQIDVNRKREAELNQLRVDITAQNDNHEKVVSDLRKKQAMAVSELEEQVAALQKSKSKLEKDVHHANAEIIDLNDQFEDTQKVKVISKF